MNRSPDEAPSTRLVARHSLIIVYIVVFVDLFGFGLILPHLPFYAMEFDASGLRIGILSTVYSATQFIGSVVFGRMSDRLGRRPVLLATLVGDVVSFLLSAAASSLTSLTIARAIAGLFGGSLGIAQAWVADVSSPQERVRSLPYPSPIIFYLVLTLVTDKASWRNWSLDRNGICLGPSSWGCSTSVRWISGRFHACGLRLPFQFDLLLVSI